MEIRHASLPKALTSVGARSIVLSVPFSLLLMIFSFTDLATYNSLIPIRFLISLAFLFILPGFNILEIAYKQTAFLTDLQRFVISIGLSIGFIIITNYAMTYLNVLINLQNLTKILATETLSLSITAFLVNWMTLGRIGEAKTRSP